MKNIKLIFLSLMVLVMTNSCDKALDINTDPLVATSADPNAVLPYVFVQYSNRHTTELGTRIMDVPQHFSACFNSPRNGSTSIFLTGNTWRMYYTQVLGNLVLVENDAIAAGESSNNVNAIAKIYKAKSFLELTSIWGAVPFTEALDGANFASPNFDDQETVLRGVLDILDEAIALIDGMPAEGTFDVSVGDMIYGGDMTKWRRWANSLKLRTLMLLRNRVNVDGDLAKVLSEPLIETNDQAAMLRYFDTPAEANAFNRLLTAFYGQTNEVAEVYAPGADLFNLLSNGDPRFDLFITDEDGGGAPPNGSFAEADEAVIRSNVIRNDLPQIMYLPSEVNFYRAELALDGFGSDNAQDQFNTGMNNILSFWGRDIPGVQMTLDQTTIDDYIASLPAVTTQSVQEQLFLESFMRPVIAWNTVRRTKVPALVPPAAASISTILKRFNYAPNEAAANKNTPANLPTDTPMWFEN